MNPPSKIDLAGYVWTISKRPQKEMPDVVGITHLDAYSIEIRDNLPPQNETDTTLHEVMHAILASQGRPFGGNVEETYVRALATGLVGALRANPELRDWLHKATQK